ncbi:MULTISPECIES: GGDEF and EAL domain-containing protein [Bacillota]|uniref:EAL domain-containing protein n=1 Tax=Amedibacillus hominis TaxID=2897776 RepID=A0ABS9RBR6_9FIRM|nr:MULTISPECIES: GGDEF and EAL domain-containing protein [Bacillota]MCH4286199.1 EAL domain-containing protein [Amedibacillus hominis]RGB53301.1 EAL domain-containing protein [Absiella sp. AM22-9]RGB59114.1 EAL domain-containing protein [Absiella sp. AM10-20]RGB67367.1 EAL domain-containing protein [Absiella sp. AM09-45]RGB76948.1 EAL domain-containing protein [Absiella sp. AM09-50]
MKKRSVKSKSILKHILVPMCILLITEIVILAISVYAGGIVERLEENSRDILQERVINKKGFLENEMNNTWSDVTLLAETINTKAEMLEKQGIISIDQLDNGSNEASPLIAEIADDMIQKLRSNRVNDIYVIFNNHDLDEDVSDKPGIYIRDMDPASKASNRNADLLIERAPASIVQKLNISTDTSWTPLFNFGKHEKDYYKFLYRPYQAALKKQKNYSLGDMGYWSANNCLDGTLQPFISYSVPLIDTKGRVYGVVGISILEEYLTTLLPNEEINGSGHASYELGITTKKANVYSPVLDSTLFDCTSNLTLLQKEEGYYVENSRDEVYAAIETLHLYNTNTPYLDEQWTIMSLIKDDDLMAFSHHINISLILAGLITLGVGMLGCVLISFKLSSPITSLSKQLKTQKKTDGKLQKTDITEIDQLVDSIESLNQNLLDSSRRFTKIIQLASVKMAGFEYDQEKNDFFITDNFFSVFLQDDIDSSLMTYEGFSQKMKEMSPYIKKKEEHKYVYHLPKDNDIIFVELTISWFDAHHVIGLAEDVTERILEQNIIEYERDHDALTGLMNRRAFHREMQILFDEPEVLKTAALLMVDLDNLKYINDHYGHDSGDTYIRKATEAFVKYSPSNTMISRVSGDEFYLFFFGYEDEEPLRKLLMELKHGIDESYITLGKYETFKIKVSGGISWYPKDATTVKNLQLYSDYAMYKVKHTCKGIFANFNKTDYDNDSYMSRNRAELLKLIETESLHYYFQPIVSTKDGSVFAYEALMRSFMPNLKNPEEILNIAKMESKLGKIEELTMFKAMEGYQENIKNHYFDENTKIFVNSIASEMLSPEMIAKFEKTFEPYLHNVVIEVTEGEKMNETLHQQKQKFVEKWHGALALDDYGSGYNSEILLLSITPKYIKIDMSFIHNIDKDNDKQKIVENIVSYGHEGGMLIIAEGVETVDEMKQVMKLKVDYLQGYLLGKPQMKSASIPNEIVKLIQSLNARR